MRSRPPGMFAWFLCLTRFAEATRTAFVHPANLGDAQRGSPTLSTATIFQRVGGLPEDTITSTHSFRLHHHILSGSRRDPEPPHNEDDTNVLVRLTQTAVTALQQPTPVASLPTGVVLALLATPLWQSLYQAILTGVLFAVLAVLGRLATADDDVDTATVPEGLPPPSSFGTDVFALAFAATTSYLVVPSSSPNSVAVVTGTSEGLTELLFGLVGVFVGFAVAMSSASSPNTLTMENSSDNDNEPTKFAVNGSVNGELLDEWDERLKIRGKGRDPEAFSTQDDD